MKLLIKHSLLAVLFSFCFTFLFTFINHVDQARAGTAIVLKHASYWPETEPCQLVCEWWMNEVEKRTKGQVKFKRYLAQSLVKAVDLLDGISSGICDVGPIAVGYTPTRLPMSTGFELQMMIPSSSIWVHAKVVKEMWETFPAFRRELTDHGLRFIGLIPVPTGVIITREGKQIKKCQDLKGVKLRAYGPVGKTINKLGGVGVSMPAPEMYTATQRGTVDGAFFTLASIPPFKMQEVTKYLVMNTGLEIYACIHHVFNQNSWDRLPAGIKKTIEEVNEEWAENAIQIWMEAEAKTLKILEDSGMVVYRLPKMEKEKWRKKLDPENYLYKPWIKEKSARGLPAARFVAKYKELVKKYEPLDKYYHLPGE